MIDFRSASEAQKQIVRLALKRVLERHSLDPSKYIVETETSIKIRCQPGESSAPFMATLKTEILSKSRLFEVSEERGLPIALGESEFYVPNTLAVRKIDPVAIDRFADLAASAGSRLPRFAAPPPVLSFVPYSEADASIKQIAKNFLINWLERYGFAIDGTRILEKPESLKILVKHDETYAMFSELLNSEEYQRAFQMRKEAVGRDRVSFNVIAIRAINPVKVAELGQRLIELMRARAVDPRLFARRVLVGDAGSPLAAMMGLFIRRRDAHHAMRERREEVVESPRPDSIEARDWDKIDSLLKRHWKYFNSQMQAYLVKCAQVDLAHLIADCSDEAHMGETYLSPVGLSVPVYPVFLPSSGRKMGSGGGSGAAAEGESLGAERREVDKVYDMLEVCQFSEGARGDHSKRIDPLTRESFSLADVIPDESVLFELEKRARLAPGLRK